MTARILMVANADFYFWLHKLPLALAARDSGFEVTVAMAEERGYGEKIAAKGLRFVPLPLERRSTSPAREARTIRALWSLYRRERPDLVQQITIKPVLYGSFVARRLKIPAIVNTIPGLGYFFVERDFASSLRQRVAAAAYRWALADPRIFTIFENPDDEALFRKRGLVPAGRSSVIRGGGVDVDRFAPSPEPAGTPIVLLASRLLWDKGVGDLVEASRLLKSRGIACRLVLVGEPDSGNPSSVPTSQLESWQAAHEIEWWGTRHDMPEVLAQASIVALPSFYREGVPRILLEAAAAGRPIVTTDTPGCREIVRNGENGLLVPPRSPDELARALTTLLQDRELRARMGECGRALAVRDFDEKRVISETLAIYRSLLSAQADRSGVGSG